MLTGQPPAWRTACLGLALLMLSQTLQAQGSTRWGLDASAGWPLTGPFRSQPAPGFGVSAYRALDERWDLGLAYSQHTFFEPDYYVSARSVDLRLRHRWPCAVGVQCWGEAGAGLNPMAWHFSNWPGWGRLSAEAGLTWNRAVGADWELGVGVAAYGPPEQALVHTILRLGPRWAWGR